MNSNIFISLALILLFNTSLFAQKDVYLTISHKLGTEAFAFHQNTENSLGHTYNISRVDYYVSNLKIVHDGGTVTPVEAMHLLVKGNSTYEQLLGEFDVENVEAITFSIGVHPSLNNADPSLQAIGSPLYYQSPSMHWGWSSGYRFVALEGKSGSNGITTYQFHGLWNDNYFEQTIAVSATANVNDEIFIHLDADYNEAVRGIDLLSGPLHHGTNEDDLTVLENFRDRVFTAGNGPALSFEQTELSFALSIHPNPTEGMLELQVDNSFQDFAAGFLQVDVCDLFGRVLNSTRIETSTLVDITNLPSGVYFLRIIEGSTVLANEKVIKK